MVKERCDGTPQLNLRVPLEHHERVHKVIALLQSTKAFAARLDELIATASEPPSFLSEVIDRIERLEAALAVQVEVNARRTASVRPRRMIPVSRSWGAQLKKKSSRYVGYCLFRSEH